MFKRKANLILIVLAMACCALLGAVGFETTVKAKAAPSDVKTLYTESGVKISQTKPFAFNLGREGQYSITVDIDEISNAEFYEISCEIFVTIGNETRYLLYNFNEEELKNYYTGVVDVTENDYIVVETNAEPTLTTTITIETLYLGEKNDYFLQEVNISYTPLTIDFLAVANTYTVTVDVYNAGQEIYETAFKVKIGDQNVTFTRAYEGVDTFTGVVEVNGEQTMTISAINNYMVNITAEIAPVYVPLPESVELTAGKTVTYSYINNKATGYYMISEVLDNRGYTLSVIFKTEPTEIEGLNAGYETPLYMEEGSIYYFEVTLIPLKYLTGSVTVTFEITEWQPPTVYSFSSYQGPVTPTSEPIAEMKIDVAEGTYYLAIIEIPTDFYNGGGEITAYIDGFGEVLLTPENGYMWEIRLNGETSVYFTANERIVIKFRIEIIQDRNYVGINETTEINLEAGFSAYYYLDKNIAGTNSEYYNITLSATDIEVYGGYNNSLSIVPSGETQGGFRVLNDSIYLITLTNNTLSEIYFQFTVTETEATVIGLGTNKIEIPAGEVVTYYADNLLSGFYTLDFGEIIGETEDIVIYESYTYLVGKGKYEKKFIVDNKAKINIDGNYAGETRFLIKNNGTVPFSSKVFINPGTDNKLPEGEPIEVNRYSHSYRAYYFVGTPGTYAIYLTLSEKMIINVTADNEDIIPYGGVSGVFTTSENGYTALRFYINNYGAETKFSVIVKAIAGEIDLDKPTEIKIDTTYPVTYSLGVLKAGRYSVEAIKGISVAVNGYFIYGTFEVTALSQACYITFFGNGEAVTFDATVKEVESYILTLGENEITMPIYGYTEYYIELDEGDYDITISGETAGITVRYEGKNIITDGETAGSISASSGMSVLVIDNYGSADEAAFTLTVTKVN